MAAVLALFAGLARAEAPPEMVQLTWEHLQQVYGGLTESLQDALAERTDAAWSEAADRFVHFRDASRQAKNVLPEEAAKVVAAKATEVNRVFAQEQWLPNIPAPLAHVIADITPHVLRSMFAAVVWDNDLGVHHAFTGMRPTNLTTYQQLDEKLSLVPGTQRDVLTGRWQDPRLCHLGADRWVVVFQHFGCQGQCNDPVGVAHVRLGRYGLVDPVPTVIPVSVSYRVYRCSAPPPERAGSLTPLHRAHIPGRRSSRPLQELDPFRNERYPASPRLHRPPRRAPM